jgi:hypothetical protein
MDRLRTFVRDFQCIDPMAGVGTTQRAATTILNSVTPDVVSDFSSFSWKPLQWG